MERSTHTGIKWVNSSNRALWAGLFVNVLCLFAVCKCGRHAGHICAFTGQLRGQRQHEISDDFWVTHTHTHAPNSLTSLFTHKPQSPCMSKPEVGYLYPQRHRAFLTHHWAIATLYSAENPVPALSISGPAAKRPATANRKKWLRAGDREYSSSLGRKGWLWGNCRLFVQARQCCVCLLLRSLASWLPLHCHRIGIMDSLAVWGTTFSAVFFPP